MNTYDMSGCPSSVYVVLSALVDASHRVQLPFLAVVGCCLKKKKKRSFLLFFIRLVSLNIGFGDKMETKKDLLLVIVDVVQCYTPDRNDVTYC